MDTRWLPLFTALALAPGGPAWAQAAAPAAVAPSELQVAVWAASCMACHGTDGKAEGTSLRLHGRTADELLGALRAYRSGERAATVMHQHAKGYTDDELQRIAQHFASRR